MFENWKDYMKDENIELNKKGFKLQRFKNSNIDEYFSKSGIDDFKRNSKIK